MALPNPPAPFLRTLETSRPAQPAAGAARGSVYKPGLGAHRGIGKATPARGGPPGEGHTFVFFVHKL